MFISRSKITSAFSMRSKQSLPNHTKQQGIAVITVILIVALLTTLMAYAAESQLLLVRRVTNQNILEQSYQLALGGEEWVSYVLETDAAGIESPDSDKADHFAEDWNNLQSTVTLDTGEVEVAVSDLSGLLNLNALAHDASRPDEIPPEFEGAVWILNNLMILLDIDTRLVGNLVDWIDQNDSTTVATKQAEGGASFPLYAGGAEDGHYTSLDKPYRTANQKLSSLGELRYIKGFNAKIIKKLAPFVTVLPSNSLFININTAPETLLKAMANEPGGEPINLDVVLGAQQDPQTILQKDIVTGQAASSWLPAAGDIVDVKSRFFAVTTKASFGDLRYSMRSILYRRFEKDVNGQVQSVQVVKRERILL